MLRVVKFKKLSITKQDNYAGCLYGGILNGTSFVLHYSLTLLSAVVCYDKYCISHI